MGLGLVCRYIYLYIYYRKIKDSIHFRSVNFTNFRPGMDPEVMGMDPVTRGPFEVPTILKSKEVNQKLVRFARKTEQNGWGANMNECVLF